MRLVTWVVCAVALAGCGDKHWAKPGATAQEFARDSYACAGEARQSWFRIGGPAWAQGDDNAVNKDLYRGCMATRGYTRSDRAGWEGFRD